MALEIKLTQKLSQSLLMTPQLKQAISLLQLGRLEYIDAIHEELLKNPVLEEVREDSSDNGDGSDRGGLSDPNSQEREVDFTPVKDDSPVAIEDYLASFNDYQTAPSQKGLVDFSNRPSVESAAKTDEDLVDYLLEQLHMDDFDAGDRLVLQHVLGNIDGQGFLRISDEELVAASGQSLEKVQSVVSMVQDLEPAGVAVRTIQECLLNQLDRLGECGLAKCIVERHLSLLERKKYSEIAKEEGVSVDIVYDAVKIILSLEPRPARQYSVDEVRYIVPDIYVYKKNGEFVITLNEDGLPRLKVSSYYRTLLEKGGEEEGKTYLSERLKAASWLIRSIHQRQQTIYKVTESIVKFQREFFELGIENLKPLVLKDVADDIGMHESTVSRVTSNKYVHTPQGVFELKFFFSSSIKSGDGNVAASSVKEKIKNLIGAEDPGRPVSDQKLVELLKEEDIDIARRTVAKYRESLGILSSSKRKKLF